MGLNHCSISISEFLIIVIVNPPAPRFPKFERLLMFVATNVFLVSDIFEINERAIRDLESPNMIFILKHILINMVRIYSMKRLL